jgi:hypothetical protein
MAAATIAAFVTPRVARVWLVRSSTCELRSGLLGLLLFLEALSSLFSLGFLFEAQLVEFREVAFAALALAVGLVGHDRLLPRSSILEPPKRGPALPAPVLG